MSIIHDALKKLEEPKQINYLGIQAQKSQKPKLKIYLIYIAVACVGLFMTNSFFNFVSKPAKGNIKTMAKTRPPVTIGRIPPQLAEKTSTSENEIFVPKETVQQEELATGQGPSFVLSGVFFSQDKGYALINNRILKEGDVIDGATVARITLDEVELKTESSTIKLSYGG